MVSVAQHRTQHPLQHVTQNPPPVSVTRVTGAGDTFMAAHIAAEIKGAAPDAALTPAETASLKCRNARVAAAARRSALLEKW